MDLIDNKLLEGVPTLVRHCVASVLKNDPGKTTADAFPICVSTMQRAGYVKAGSTKLTAAGAAKEASHEAEPDAGKKLNTYHSFLKQARQEALDNDQLRLVSREAELLFEDSGYIHPHQLPPEVRAAVQQWGRRSAAAFYNAVQRTHGINPKQGIWQTIKKAASMTFELGVSALIGGLLGGIAAFALPTATLVVQGVKELGAEDAHNAARGMLKDVIRAVAQMQQQAKQSDDELSQIYYQGLHDGLLTLNPGLPEALEQAQTVQIEEALLNEGKFTSYGDAFVDLIARWFDKKKTNRDLKIQFNKLNMSILQVKQAMSRITMLAKKLGIEISVEAQSTPEGLVLRVVHGTAAPLTGKDAGQLPSAPPVTESLEALEEARKRRSVGRPSLPIGAVRRWKKEGKTYPMVKIDQPDVWIHKKNTEAASRSGRMKRGAVRNWRRGTMVRLAPGHWIRKKGKYSHESLDTPELRLLGERLEAQDRQKNSIKSLLDLRAIHESCGCGCDDCKSQGSAPASGRKSTIRELLFKTK